MATKAKKANASLVLDQVPGVTRYVQVANFVRHKIASSEWPVGKVLPTVQAFSEELGIARVTVRQAYAILVREKLITSERGRGSHVRGTPRPANSEMSAAINNWLDLPDGFQIRVLEKEDGVALPSELLLAGTPAEKYVHLKKIHLHNKQIILAADFYVASDIFARFPKGSEKEEKITALLPRYSVEKMKSLRQVTTVSQADSELSKLLRCNFSAPVAKVKRCVTTHAGTIIYASVTNYRGDRFVFDMTLPVDVMYGRQIKASQAVKGAKRKERS